MLHNYGSSNNPQYLLDQIQALDNYISQMAWKMSLQEIAEKYTQLDQLQTRYNSLTNPTHLDNVAEWKSRQCGEW